ncbi:hypothetical protein LCGC14_1736350 [marine sediment metagenome]|uniref:Uncharacterized protein n=1 Tax=marine sediment metagenome TaxID=412755 RepID=A0A0F9JNF2_9ZZZZ
MIPSEDEDLPPERDVYQEHMDNSNDAALIKLENPPPEPELDFCSRCHEHADFELDEDNEWVSGCCGVQPVSVDQERDYER